MSTLRTRYKKSEDVRERLLDSAEALFAKRGFYGVSVRDITDQTGVGNASINYHFGSKKKLFLAIIDRRIEPLTKARLEKLEEFIADPAHPEPCVRTIVEAFAEPMLDFVTNGDPGWKQYCIIVANLSTQHIEGAEDKSVVSIKYDTTANLFLGALRDTFPSADEYQVQCSFQFLLSTLLYAVCDNKRINNLSGGCYRSDDLIALKTPILQFATSGILGVMNINQPGK